MTKLLRLRDFSNYKASAWALVAANALPLFGVLFFGWDTFSIVFLYWVENVIIGAINVLKMIACDPDAESVDWSSLETTDDLYRLATEGKRDGSFNKLRLANHGSKLFFVPFFIFHYGLFCLVHGIFIFVIFGRGAGVHSPVGLLESIPRLLSAEHLWVGVLALAASHLWSFVVNFLVHGEYRRTAVPLLMAQPYARVVVLHLAILFGALFAFAMGSNIVVLMILIAGKTILDLSLHLRERERNEGKPTSNDAPILPEVITGEEGQAPPKPPATVQPHPPARSSSDD